MKIYTKKLSGGSRLDTIKALFTYAKDALGDGWIYDDTSSLTAASLIFSDSAGERHGWIFDANTSPSLISNGVVSKSGHCSSTNVSDELQTFTGVVWKSNNGSVGIGRLGDDGKYKTWYLLIKFDGKYIDKDVYGVGFPLSSGSYGDILVHGNINIGVVNHVPSEGVAIGFGVYLHPVYDPISGLTSSDIFGPQSMESSLYAVDGITVKQGTNSYMSVLASTSTSGNPYGVLYVKT